MRPQPRLPPARGETGLTHALRARLLKRRINLCGAAQVLKHSLLIP